MEAEGSLATPAFWALRAARAARRVCISESTSISSPLSRKVGPKLHTHVKLRPAANDGHAFRLRNSTVASGVELPPTCPASPQLRVPEGLARGEGTWETQESLYQVRLWVLDTSCLPASGMIQVGSDADTNALLLLHPPPAPRTCQGDRKGTSPGISPQSGSRGDMAVPQGLQEGRGRGSREAGSIQVAQSAPKASSGSENRLCTERPVDLGSLPNPSFLFYKMG